MTPRELVTKARRCREHTLFRHNSSFDFLVNYCDMGGDAVTTESLTRHVREVEMIRGEVLCGHRATRLGAPRAMHSQLWMRNLSDDAVLEMIAVLDHVLAQARQVLPPPPPLPFVEWGRELFQWYCPPYRAGRKHFTKRELEQHIIPLVMSSMAADQIIREAKFCAQKMAEKLTYGYMEHVSQSLMNFNVHRIEDRIMGELRWALLTKQRSTNQTTEFVETQVKKALAMVSPSERAIWRLFSDSFWWDADNTPQQILDYGQAAVADGVLPREELALVARVIEAVHGVQIPINGINSTPCRAEVLTGLATWDKLISSVTFEESRTNAVLKNQFDQVKEGATALLALLRKMRRDGVILTPKAIAKAIKAEGIEGVRIRTEKRQSLPELFVAADVLVGGCEWKPATGHLSWRVGMDTFVYALNCLVEYDGAPVAHVGELFDGHDFPNLFDMRQEVERILSVENVA